MALTELESIELEIATPCAFCVDGWFSLQTLNRFWCLKCGGSGLKRTERKLPFTLYAVTRCCYQAPYLQEEAWKDACLQEP